MDMPGRERAMTADFHLNVDSDDKISSISPIFNHRIINLTPLFPIRNSNYLVGVFNLLITFVSFFLSFSNKFSSIFYLYFPSIYHRHLLLQLID